MYFFFWKTEGRPLPSDLMGEDSVFLLPEYPTHFFLSSCQVCVSLFLLGKRIHLSLGTRRKEEWRRGWREKKTKKKLLLDVVSSLWCGESGLPRLEKKARQVQKLFQIARRSWLLMLICQTSFVAHKTRTFFYIAGYETIAHLPTLVDKRWE